MNVDIDPLNFQRLAHDYQKLSSAVLKRDPMFDFQTCQWSYERGDAVEMDKGDVLLQAEAFRQALNLWQWLYKEAVGEEAYQKKLLELTGRAST